MIEEKKNDKVSCFARLSEVKCNALSKKNCENCRFYKHYLEVEKYKKYLPKKMEERIWHDYRGKQND